MGDSRGKFVHVVHAFTPIGSDRSHFYMEKHEYGSASDLTIYRDLVVTLRLRLIAEVS